MAKLLYLWQTFLKTAKWQPWCVCVRKRERYDMENISMSKTRICKSNVHPISPRGKNETTKREVGFEKQIGNIFLHFIWFGYQI